MPVVAERSRRRAEPILPRPARVVRRVRETGDVITLVLDDSGCADFRPGQFMMLLAPGVGEVPISISGASPDGFIAQTIRAVGPVSRALVRLDKGVIVGVRGPYGSAWPIDAAQGRDVLLVAGGIGLAPLRPVIQQLLAQRPRYGRLVALCGARTPADLLFRSDLERWRSRLDVDLRVTVDSAPADWRGEVGVVTRLAPRAGIDPDNTLAMLCGPEVMMRAAAATLLDAGLGLDDIWVSMERSMLCGVGLCGHCQLGPLLICRDGPVLRLDRVAPLWSIREL
jgi:NAD(P)H-flavin reductase